MKKKILTATAAAIVCLACTHSGKISVLMRDGTAAGLSLPAENTAATYQSIQDVLSDTITIKSQVRKNGPILMSAIKDEDGEMVAHEEIKAAVVTARFRNVAERNGKVDIAFDVTIPGELTDTDWLVQFHPLLLINGDTLRMDDLQVTGAKYRKMQLRGYEKYNKFLASIISDSTKMIDRHQLEVFIQRNYKSLFGVTREEAVEHFTRDYIVRRNRRKIAMKDRMRDKYIKMPIVKEGLRLDTIVSEGSSDIVYRYVQTLDVSSKMKKVSVVLDGEVFQEDQLVYTTPQSRPLDFYISSLSTLVDDRAHFISSVIYRNAEANTACYIDFASGSSNIELDREENRREVSRIKKNLVSLLEDKDFLIDSIKITASCSPEGSFQTNKALAAARAESVKTHFNKYLTKAADSLDADRKGIKFITASVPEDWEMLDKIVRKDSLLAASEKEDYASLAGIDNPDKREAALSGRKYYMHLREKLYPRLRIVRFDFHLHRKGMIKDTVHTTLPDSVYDKGVMAIKDRDYNTAIKLLRPYHDYNTAVAYCAAGYNASAREILESLHKDDKVLYLLSLVYSRIGKKQEAIESYLEACRMNPSLVNRGNLDPEISSLVKEFNLQDKLFNII